MRAREDRPPRALASGTLKLEVLALLAAPAVLYFILQLRGMAPPLVPDPGEHTTFIIDPHAIFARYQAIFAPTARMREAARVGFLVPARLSYLLFGAVGGFFVFRYLLALTAIVPLYLLLRRLYGRWAGFAGVVLVMSSPVLVTAWGTDYPDSATVSYLIAALATLGLSWLSRRPVSWLAAAGGLFALAVWSLGAAGPLVASMAIAYIGVRLLFDRRRLWLGIGAAALSGLVATLLLAVASKLVIGQFDFVTPTIRSAEVLSQAAYVRLYHSSSWAWAPYDPYLLVPPSIVLAYAVVFARRWREISPLHLFIGAAGALQVASFAYLQFFGSEEFLEMYHFSSTLWASVTVMLALIVAEVSQPMVRRGLSWRSVLPAVLVLVIALVYEAISPHLPGISWFPGGAILGGALISAAGVGRLAPTEAPWLRPVLAAASAVVVLGATLVLTLAPAARHGLLPGTVQRTAPDPVPPYADALGGYATDYIEEYGAAAKLPAFVGPPAYRGEQLLTWWPTGDIGRLLDEVGMYHAGFNHLSLSFPQLDSLGVEKIKSRRAAQVLIMGFSEDQFDQAVGSLAAFEPVVVRRGVLSYGSYHVHVWLVDLRRNLRPTTT